MTRDGCLDMIAPSAPKNPIHGQVQVVHAQHNGQNFVPTSLGRLASLLNGDRGENYPARSDMLDDGVPFINAGHLHDGSVQLAGMNYLSEAQFATLRGGSVLPGDILYCLRGSLGKAAFVDNIDRAAIASSLVIIRVNADVSARYVYHFLTSPLGQQYIKKFDNGAAQPNLSARSLAQFHVPLPPLPEQKRIAAILDKADAIRRKRQQAIQFTENLLRSAFLEMFGDPVTNPKAWPVRPLGTVIDKLESGWSANGDARTRQPGEYGVLKLSAVTSGSFRPEEHKAIPSDAIDRDLVTPRAGDLLFSRANTRELVAATCLIQEGAPRLFLPDKIWRVIPRAQIATTPYLKFLLAHERFRGELTKTATGTSGSMLNVSMEKLRQLPAPIPPYADQSRFSELVWSALRAKTKFERAYTATDELFASLVNHTLAGDLAV